ncbi:MAG TPA: hypothetical protein DER33_04820 [Syntrophomonas sp.]|nr:hypothetical protein [Syntrophomonas sp.]
MSFKRFPLTAVDELEPERPVLLKQATTMLIKNKVLTVADIIDNIKLPQIEIEHLCGVSPGALTIGDQVISLEIK